MKAIWKNQILAESLKTIVVENNHYFPVACLHMDFFIPSNTTTHCPWKGQASYYTVRVDGVLNQDAAWYYLEPRSAAAQIKDHVAFWHGVEVTD